MIKAIIFDWGGVLADNPTEDLMKYFAKSLETDTNKFKEIFSKYESCFQKDNISENNLWNKICTELNIKKTSSNSLWKEAIKNTLKNKSEVYDLIQHLKNKKYKIGLLSNTEIPTMEFFFENNHQKYFDATTFSCVENTIKPEEKNLSFNFK